MQGIKLSVLVGTLGVMGLALWASAQADRSGSDMVTAANRWLSALDDGQKRRASFAFDDPERTNWHFIPRDRKGLSIKEMTPEQRALAFGLLETGLGAAGSLKATTIMSLEAILRDMEKGSGPVRDPERYYFSVFGTPGESGSWGWRVEGHHLSLNLTLDGARIVSATPAFFGANPAEVRSGPRAGLRTLAESEDRALRLLQALDDGQRKEAILAPEAPKEVKSGTLKGSTGGLTTRPAQDPLEGVLASRLNQDQRRMLTDLIRSYIDNMPTDVSRAWMTEVNQSGSDLAFGWYGPADRNQPHGYKVQGKTFLIEFNNTQNGANHIHSLWRGMDGDFGLKK